MGFISRVWKDRKSEYPNRRLLTKENGSTELVTVSREEGIISEEGSAFSAANMNDLEQRIEDAIGTGDIPEELGTDIITALTTLNSNLIKYKELTWQGDTTADTPINLGTIKKIIPDGSTFICAVVKYCAGAGSHDPCNAIMNSSNTYLYVYPTKTQNSVFARIIVFYI